MQKSSRQQEEEVKAESCQHGDYRIGWWLRKESEAESEEWFWHTMGQFPPWVLKEEGGGPEVNLCLDKCLPKEHVPKAWSPPWDTTGRW